MSMENVKKLYEFVQQDHSLQEKIGKMIDIKNLKSMSSNELVDTVEQKILPLAKTLGLSFTAEEFFDYQTSQVMELTDDALTDVSGGFSGRQLMATSLLGLTALGAAASMGATGGGGQPAGAWFGSGGGRSDTSVIRQVHAEEPLTSQNLEEEVSDVVRHSSRTAQAAAPGLLGRTFNATTSTINGLAKTVVKNLPRAFAVIGAAGAARTVAGATSDTVVESAVRGAVWSVVTVYALMNDASQGTASATPYTTSAQATQVATPDSPTTPTATDKGEGATELATGNTHDTHGETSDAISPQGTPAEPSSVTAAAPSAGIEPETPTGLHEAPPVALTEAERLPAATESKRPAAAARRRAKTTTAGRATQQKVKPDRILGVFVPVSIRNNPEHIIPGTSNKKTQGQKDGRKKLIARINGTGNKGPLTKNEIAYIKGWQLGVEPSHDDVAEHQTWEFFQSLAAKAGKQESTVKQERAETPAQNRAPAKAIQEAPSRKRAASTTSRTATGPTAAPVTSQTEESADAIVVDSTAVTAPEAGAEPKAVGNESAAGIVVDIPEVTTPEAGAEPEAVVNERAGATQEARSEDSATTTTRTEAEPETAVKTGEAVASVADAPVQAAQTQGSSTWLAVVPPATPSGAYGNSQAYKDFSIDLRPINISRGTRTNIINPSVLSDISLGIGEVIKLTPAPEESRIVLASQSVTPLAASGAQTSTHEEENLEDVEEPALDTLTLPRLSTGAPLATANTDDATTGVDVDIHKEKSEPTQITFSDDSANPRTILSNRPGPTVVHEHSIAEGSSNGNELTSLLHHQGSSDGVEVTAEVQHAAKHRTLGAAITQHSLWEEEGPGRDSLREKLQKGGTITELTDSEKSYIKTVLERRDPWENIRGVLTPLTGVASSKSLHLKGFFVVLASEFNIEYTPSSH